MNVKNRNCIRKLSFQSLWASRKRNLIAVAAIVLTTLLFTSLFTVVMSINSSYQTYTFRQIGGYCHGTFKDVSEEQAKAISAHSKVEAVGARKVVGFAADGVFARKPAEVSYMDENCTKWSYALPAAGRMPEKGKEVAMDTAALKLLGIKPELGAEVSLTYTVGDKNQTAFERTDTFTLVGYWEYDDISPVHFINISEDYAQAMEAEGMAAGMEAFRTDLNVMMASSLDIRGQMEQVDRDLGYSWEEGQGENVVRIGVNWGYTSEQMTDSMDLETILAMAAFLVLVIFTGYLIIYNIFQISVTGDIRFYGLLKTIGTTPRQLRRMIRQQALLLCVAGIPVGLLLGYGVGAVLTPVVMERTSLGTVTSTISTSPWIFLLSALLALITVLLSCSRPGRIAARVSPVEATKYTEVMVTKKKCRSTRGAKVHQMAFANLGRNKVKTVLVVVSLALSVVLLNVLYTFTGGFDMEKYLAKSTCADFIVSSPNYFRFESGMEEYISQDIMGQIQAHTAQTTAGCGYTLSGSQPLAWMSEEAWKTAASPLYSVDMIDTVLAQHERKGNLVAESTLLQGLDEALFEKVTVVEGDLGPLMSEGDNGIALEVDVDDYGNAYETENYPAIGDTLTVIYIDEAYFIDSRTGEKCDETTPEEYLKYHIVRSHEVDYTLCAYVIVPRSMGYRYSTMGYNTLLPVEKMERDSGQKAIPLFYLFDTPDSTAESSAESYLADLTEGELSGLMYESKATVRQEFEGFQNMFLLLGGLLCAIIGLVGVLNFFNAIMTGILSRRRDFAVLQSVGMTSRQLKAMLIYEGMFYALGAAAAALILSVVLNPLVGNLLENMFWFFTAKFTVTPVLLAIPVFALLGWLIPSIMYGQTTKHSVVERLREAE
ncbi:MAG: ABC transporter permease [Firmicutes bacterium]|nr:ABC transporter permease [Bacillota bacterium]